MPSLLNFADGRLPDDARLRRAERLKVKGTLVIRFTGVPFAQNSTLTKEQIMKSTASEKAVDRGKRDCRDGVTRNPFLHIGGKHKHLASWWDKGFAEEQAKQGQRPN